MDSPIERVRYNLAGADKARAAAKRYDAMHDSLKRDGKHSIGAIVRSRARNIFGIPEKTIEMVLDNEDARRLAEWFYEKRDRELKRAEGYEKEALRAATVEQEKP